MNLKQKRRLLIKEKIDDLNKEIMLAKGMYEKGVIKKGLHDHIINSNTKKILDLTD